VTKTSAISRQLRDGAQLAPGETWELVDEVLKLARSPRRAAVAARRAEDTAEEPGYSGLRLGSLKTYHHLGVRVLKRLGLSPARAVSE